MDLKCIVKLLRYEYIENDINDQLSYVKSNLGEVKDFNVVNRVYTDLSNMNKKIESDLLLVISYVPYGSGKVSTTEVPRKSVYLESNN